MLQSGVVTAHADGTKRNVANQAACFRHDIRYGRGQISGCQSNCVERVGVKSPVVKRHGAKTQLDVVAKCACSASEINAGLIKAVDRHCARDRQLLVRKCQLKCCQKAKEKNATKLKLLLKKVVIL